MQAKHEAIATIEQLPEDADMDDIMYRLYLLSKIRKGQQDIESGESLTSEELAAEIESW